MKELRQHGELGDHSKKARGLLSIHVRFQDSSVQWLTIFQRHNCEPTISSSNFEDIPQWSVTAATFLKKQTLHLVR